MPQKLKSKDDSKSNCNPESKTQVYKNPVTNDLNYGQKICVPNLPKKDKDCKKCIECDDKSIDPLLKISNYPNNEEYELLVIKNGDTLSEIAKKKNTTVKKLLELNPYIGNKNLIFPGNVIKVPKGITNNNKVSNTWSPPILNTWNAYDVFTRQFSTPTWVPPNLSILINGKTVTARQIIENAIRIRQSLPISTYNSLSENEKMILDLPIIMVRLRMLYGAYFMVYWLDPKRDESHLRREKAGDTTQPVLEVPFERFSEAEDNKDAFNKLKQEICNDMMKANFLSTEDIDYGDVYDIEKEYYTLFDNKEAPQKVLKGIKDEIRKFNGDFNCVDLNYFDKSKPKAIADKVLIGSYSVGSIFGELSDIGSAFGRYSFRVYANGKVEECNCINKNAIFKIYTLKIDKVSIRVFDSYDFGTDFLDGYNIMDAKQPLGIWKWDLNYPDVTKDFRYLRYANYKSLNNSNFRSLHNKTRLGKNFYVKTQEEYLDCLPSCITFILNK